MDSHRDVHASSGAGGDGGGLSPDDIVLQPSHSAVQVRHMPRSLENPSAEVIAEGAPRVGWMSKRGYKVGCIPSWKRRWFILRGGYLFKYDSPMGSSPKGSPIPILGLTWTMGPVDPKPSEHSHTITLSTLRREYVLGAGSAEELQGWIDDITAAKSLVIKQGLGHAPVSEGDEFAARAGEFLTQKRLDRETDELERRPASNF